MRHKLSYDVPYISMLLHTKYTANLNLEWMEWGWQSRVDELENIFDLMRWKNTKMEQISWIELSKNLFMFRIFIPFHWHKCAIIQTAISASLTFMYDTIVVTFACTQTHAHQYWVSTLLPNNIDGFTSRRCVYVNVCIFWFFYVDE